MRDFTFVRHGSTKLNDDPKNDKIRGWLDVPLDEHGKKEAVGIGKKMKGQGYTHIVTSDLQRASATANEIAKNNPGAQVIKSQKLRPWNLGKFNGQASQQVHPEIRKFIQTPDKKVPQGESFNAFKARAFKGLNEAVNHHPGGKVAVVSHHRVDRLIDAWQRNGSPKSHEVDTSAFNEKGQKPGTARKVSVDENALRGDTGEPSLQQHMGTLMSLFGAHGAHPAPSLGNAMPEEQ